MATTFKPSQWGPASTSKDYEFFMQGDTVVSSPVSLLNHAITSPSQELSDPVTITTVKKVRGKLRQVQQIVRQAQQISLSYTVQFPSALYTPALDLARKGTGCETDFYAVRLCPGNEQFNHAYIYPDSTLAPPSEINDFITTEDDTIVQEQTTLTTTERLILWAQHVSEVFTTATSQDFFAAAFYERECEDCDDTLGSYVEMVVGGGTGAANALLDTEDRFTASALFSTGAPASVYFRDIWTKGNIIFAGFSDATSVGSGTAGGTIISTDDGSNFSLDTNITASVYGARKYLNLYLAAGGNGGAAPYFAYATDGKTYTPVSSTLLSATFPISSIAVDEEDGVFYMTTLQPKLIKGEYSGGSIVLTDLTSTLPATLQQLYRVTVLGRKHIIVGGANGYLAESLDGGDSWDKPAISGTGTIAGIAGNRHRTVIGVGSTLYERSVLTNFDFKPMTLQTGTTVSGNITAITNPPNEFNYFLAVTDEGEVIFTKPFYPGA